MIHMVTMPSISLMEQRITKIIGNRVRARRAAEVNRVRALRAAEVMPNPDSQPLSCLFPSLDLKHPSRR